MKLPLAAEKNRKVEEEGSWEMGEKVRLPVLTIWRFRKSSFCWLCKGRVVEKLGFSPLLPTKKRALLQFLFTCHTLTKNTFIGQFCL